MGAEEDIAAALRPTVRAAGLEIWDVERSGTTVRVLVDRAGGVDLDQIAAASRAISVALDEHDDLIPGDHYNLEVSSPGLERRLRHPRHFASYVGHEIAVKTSQVVNGARRLRGTLVGATDDEIVLRTPLSPTTQEDVVVPLGVVERANTVFTWGEAPAALVPAKAKAKRKTGPARGPVASPRPMRGDSASAPAQPRPGDTTSGDTTSGDMVLGDMVLEDNEQPDRLQPERELAGKKLAEAAEEAR